MPTCPQQLKVICGFDHGEILTVGASQMGQRKGEIIGELVNGELLMVFV